MPSRLNAGTSAKIFGFQIRAHTNFSRRERGQQELPIVWNYEQWGLIC